MHVFFVLTDAYTCRAHNGFGCNSRVSREANVSILLRCIAGGKLKKRIGATKDTNALVQRSVDSPQINVLTACVYMRVFANRKRSVHETCKERN